VTERTPNTDSPGQAPDTRRPTGGQPARAVSGKPANVLGAAFYTVVAAVALAGQAIAAVHWLDWHWLPALAAVSALELGGIALAARADFRRRLNESAIASRLLSAAVAVFAVVFNWLGHDDHLQGGFFAGMSALGYGVWLINAGDRRRDQLRAERKLPPTAPSYGLVQWLRQPWITRGARLAALKNPSLGLFESLDAARAAVRVERRNAALAEVLNRMLTKDRDALYAQLAVNSYDLNEIAVRVAATADYDGLAAQIAVHLTPDRLTASPTMPPARKPDTAAADRKPASADTGGTVVSLNGAGSRRRPKVDSAPKVVPDTSAAVTVEQLADTLTARHRGEYVGTPTAQSTLRQVYGSCSKERAIDAKKIHNARRETQADSGGESADDPKEDSHDLVSA
jgi:hypothetical protein